CGDYPLLRRYERARKEDVATLQFTTHALQKLFANERVSIAKARNAGLKLVNRQPQLKNFLVRQAVACIGGKQGNIARVLVATMAACLLGLLAAPARADEADLRKAFQARFPEATVESITRTPFTGLYEIVFDGQVVYADEKLNYMFFGNLYDMRGRTERNLT